MAEFPRAEKFTLSGDHQPVGRLPEAIELSVHQILGTSGSHAPAVVFCHGFPDLAYSWRHQLETVGHAGFRAVAPDQRGYGNSSSPEQIEAFGLGQLCGDLVELLDALEIDTAVFVGHDWGGFVAWGMPVLFPERCAGVVGVCTPYTPFPTTEFLKMMFGEDLEQMYMLWFQSPGVAEAILDTRARLLFEKLSVCGVDPLRLAELGMARESGFNFNPFIDLEGLPNVAPSVLTAQDLDLYSSTFERTGFRGPLNWYRNIDQNAVNFPEVGTQALQLPALMICAEWDPALPPELASGMPLLCSDLEMHTVAKAGHWVHEEFPDRVNHLIVDWLTRKFVS
ncbi:MAG: alpha/beta hydrolase [Microthrixaceae bacterium]